MSLPILPVSVVIPTFRREVMLAEAIASALVQNGVEVEVIVADDSPEASALPVVNRIGDARVKFVHHTPTSNGFVSKVRNAALDGTRFPLVLFLDDDDRLEPGALSTLGWALRARPDVGVAFGRLIPFGPRSDVVAKETRYFEAAAARARRIRGPRSFAWRMLFGPALLACSAVMVRVDALRAAGGFDEDLRVWEDGECYLRVGRRSGIIFVDAPVTQRRVGHLSLVTNIKQEQEIVAAYRHMHTAYRRRFGAVEFLGLKVQAKLLSGMV